MPDYTLPLGLDGSNILKGFHDIEAGLDKLIEKADSANETLTATFGRSARAAGQMDNALSGVSPTLGRIANTASQVDKTVSAMGVSIKRAASSSEIDQYRASFTRLRDIINGAAHSAGSLERSTIRITSANNKMGQSLNSLTQRMQHVRTLIFNERDVARAREYSQELNRLQQDYDELARAQRGAGNESSGWLDKIANKIGVSGDMLKKGVGAVAAFFAVDKIIAFGSEVVATTAKFQRFESVLKTALGSEYAAAKALDMITEFAVKTPFAVDEITGAFTKLANRGIRPTMDELTKMGDLASSQGKGLDQYVEALMDAQTGEFERLKEFGIRAKKSGDEVSLTFKGVTQTVKNTDEAIKDAIVSMGAMAGVAGSMEGVSKTIGGQISNIGDAWDQLMLSIGKGIAPVVSSVLTGLSKIIDGIGSLVSSKEEAVKIAADAAIKNKQEADSGQALLDKYISLKEKGVKATADEKRQLRVATQQLANAFGDSILQINAETGALEVNIDATKALIQQKYILANQAVADILGQERIIKAALARNKQEVDNAKALLEETKKADPAAQGLANRSIRPVGKEGLKTGYDFLSDKDKARVDAITQAQATLNGYINKTIELRQKESAIIEAKKRLNVENLDTEAMDRAEAERLKKAEEERKKASETTVETDKERKKREAAENKAAAARKRQAEQEYDLMKRLRDAHIAAMQEGYDKERKQAESAYEDKKHELEKLENLTKDGEANRTALLKLAADERDKAIADINAKESAARLIIEFEAQRQLNEISKEGLAKELTAIQFNYEAKAAEIRKTYKDRQDLEIRLLDELQAAKQRREAAASTADALNRLGQNTDIATALVESAFISGQNKDVKTDKGGRYNSVTGKTAEIQALKGLAATEAQLAEDNKIGIGKILKDKALLLKAITINSVQERIEILKNDPNTDPNTIKLAKAELDKLRSEFTKEIKEGEKVDITALFDTINAGSAIGTGFRGLANALSADLKSQGGKSLLEAMGLDEAAIAGIASALDQAASLYSQFIQSQIDEKQRQIDALNVQIDKAEGLYEKELEAQKKGYANNADAKKKELDDLKKQRDKDQADKQALLVKQRQLAQAQIAINTAAQVSAIILAGAEAMKGAASIPLVGVAVGLGLIATLISGFLAFKAQASKTDVQQFGEGGWIDGKPHSEGGQKYRSMDGKGGVVELEGGEHVTKKKQAAKFAGSLEAINNDDVHGLMESLRAEADFEQMLASMGIRLMGEQKEQAMQQNRDLTQKVVVMMYGSNGNNSDQYLKNIADNTAVLAHAERERESVTFEDGYKVIRKGNLTRKIKQS